MVLRNTYLTCTAVAVICLASRLGAQEVSPQRDVEAVAILQQSATAMGVVNLADIHDTVAQLQVTTYRGERTRTGNAVVKTLGREYSRTQTDSSDLQTVLVTRTEAAYLKTGTEKTRRIPLLSLGPAGMSEVPLLSIVGQWQDSSLKLEYAGLETRDGSSLYHLRMRRPNRAHRSELGDFAPACEAYIDPATFLVVKLVYSMRPPANLLYSEPVEVSYADYRPVSGILIPFKVSYRVRGRLVSEHQVVSFAVNQGVQQSEFDIP